LSVSFLQDLVSGFVQTNGSVVVPAVDEAANLADEFADGSEGAAVDRLTFDDAKSDLD